MTPPRTSRALWPLLALPAAAVAASVAFAGYRGCADDVRRVPGFRVAPYLQNPAPDAITVIWFTDTGEPGALRFRPAPAGDGEAGARDDRPMSAWTVRQPDSALATALAAPGWATPRRHRVRLTGLSPDTRYAYEVTHGPARFASWFTTAPGPASTRPVRIVFTADCEAEPESTGARVAWDPPGDPARRNGSRGDLPRRDSSRRYLIDQTEGLARHLAVIRARDPDLIAIAGDLVEAGGEQKDWDELWRHLAPADPARSLAGRVPVLAAPGNHEYWGGRRHGGYRTAGSERAIARFDAYFEPPGESGERPGELLRPPPGARWWRIDYGPVAIVGVDATNGSPHETPADTNYFLRGARDPGGGSSPGFAPGTAQYAWLAAQLEDAQRTAAFTFVVLHHVPYSSGPHGWPPGRDRAGAAATAATTRTTTTDPQSGVPVRALTPLFVARGVDAVIAGHDEMFERSAIAGDERLDGATRPHTVHFYDVGVCGDGLRTPASGLVNPYRQFLAHEDAPEVWEDGVLLSGGKHYGHLEVTVDPSADAAAGPRWRAELVPVYVLPVVAGGRVTGHERRVYDDTVVLRAAPRP